MTFKLEGPASIEAIPSPELPLEVNCLLQTSECFTRSRDTNLHIFLLIPSNQGSTIFGKHRIQMGITYSEVDIGT